MTCKNQLTYVYHITPPPLPPSSSRAPPPPTPSSDSLLLSPSALLFPPTPSTSPVDGDVLLARLRVVQEEVLWRNAEDDYAFPHGRCRFVLPSPARLPFFGQPTPRRVSYHSLSTSVHAASWEHLALNHLFLSLSPPCACAGERGGGPVCPQAGRG